MPSVQLLQVTDPHLYADETREIYDTNTAHSLRAVLKDAAMARPRPHAVLATGDVAEDGTPEAYANFRRALATLEAPVYCLPGNHDAPATMATALSGQGFQYCGRAELGAWLLVLLDTHVPEDPAGLLADGELERLERELRAAPGRPTLVALHHPPVKLGSAWLDAYGLRNASRFLGLLSAHPQVRAVVTGHVHQAADHGFGTLRVLTSPSTCAQFKPGTRHCVMDDRPPGYRWITLHDDGGLATDVGWVSDWHRAAPPRDTRGPGMG